MQIKVFCSKKVYANLSRFTPSKVGNKKIHILTNLFFDMYSKESMAVDGEIEFIHLILLPYDSCKSFIQQGLHCNLAAILQWRGKVVRMNDASDGATKIKQDNVANLVGGFSNVDPPSRCELSNATAFGFLADR